MTFEAWPCIPVPLHCARQGQTTQGSAFIPTTTYPVRWKWTEGTWERDAMRCGKSSAVEKSGVSGTVRGSGNDYAMRSINA